MDTLDSRFDTELVRERAVRQDFLDSLDLMLDGPVEYSHKMSGQRHVTGGNYRSRRNGSKWQSSRCDDRHRDDWHIAIFDDRRLGVRSCSNILAIIVLYLLGRNLVARTIQTRSLQVRQTSIISAPTCGTAYLTHVSTSRDRSSSLGSTLGLLRFQPCDA